MLYVKLLKALLGLLKSALLFYKKLAGELVSMGFNINPYDQSVVDKIVNGTQMSVTWHVDNLKVSHKDPIEVLKLPLEIAKIYGPGVTVTQGKLHSYLGIDFDYSTPQSVKVSMINMQNRLLMIFCELLPALQARSQPTTSLL